MGVAALVAISLSACGDDSDGLSNDFPPPSVASEVVKKGGDLIVLSSGDVGSLDPGAAHDPFSYMISGATQRQLLSYMPGAKAEASPDLATKPPTISEDGKTVTFELQSDNHFSPPVNREVVCDDFRYAIERTLLPGVGNPYTPVYFKDAVGFGAAIRAVDRDPTKAPEISGLQCADDQTLVIKLTKASSPGVIGALALPAGAPVPREYAAPLDARSPSAYGTHQVATGPYMIANNSSGKLTGYTPGAEISLVRNPKWNPVNDWRPAYLHSIDVQEGLPTTGTTTKRILRGTDQVNGDFSVSDSALRDAANAAQGQLAVTPSGGSRYMALNTGTPPFDDIDVRKAVVAAADRAALRDTLGGRFAGPAMTHFIPPGIPGFNEAGGVAGPDLDFLKHPKGDIALAASYMRKAGFTSGRCEGPSCAITMVGADSAPGAQAAGILAGRLERLGFDVSSRTVSADEYSQICDGSEAVPDVCAGDGASKDFLDPERILEAVSSGLQKAPSGGSQALAPKTSRITAAIRRAAQTSDPELRAEAWARVDELLTKQAVAVPWGWDYEADIQSTNVTGVINLFTANWDLSFTSLK